MKILVVIEHDNITIKQSSYSTITAASQINENVEAIILGEDLSSVTEKLKKSAHLKKVYVVDNKLFQNPLAENLSKTLKTFVEGKDFTHVLSPSSTFGKNMSPKLATLLDVQQVSDITKIIIDEINNTLK